MSTSYKVINLIGSGSRTVVYGVIPLKDIPSDSSSSSASTSSNETHSASSVSPLYYPPFVKKIFLDANSDPRIRTAALNHFENLQLYSTTRTNDNPLTNDDDTREHVFGVMDYGIDNENSKDIYYITPMAYGRSLRDCINHQKQLMEKENEGIVSVSSSSSSSSASTSANHQNDNNDTTVPNTNHETSLESVHPPEFIPVLPILKAPSSPSISSPAIILENSSSFTSSTDTVSSSLNGTTAESSSTDTTTPTTQDSLIYTTNSSTSVNPASTTIPSSSTSPPSSSSSSPSPSSSLLPPPLPSAYLLSVTALRHVAYHTLLGLHSLHRNNILHCDIKPENIMLQLPEEYRTMLSIIRDDPDPSAFSVALPSYYSSILPSLYPSLIPYTPSNPIPNDASSSIDTNDPWLNYSIALTDIDNPTLIDPSNETNHMYGNIRIFLAPEILQEEPYSFATDIWSYGATLLYCGTGIAVGGTPKLRSSLLRGTWSWENFVLSFSDDQKYLWNRLPSDVQEYIQGCLQYDPRLRPTTTALLHHSVHRSLFPLYASLHSRRLQIIEIAQPLLSQLQYQDKLLHRSATNDKVTVLQKELQEQSSELAKEKKHNDELCTKVAGLEEKLRTMEELCAQQKVELQDLSLLQIYGENNKDKLRTKFGLSSFGSSIGTTKNTTDESTVVSAKGKMDFSGFGSKTGTETATTGDVKAKFNFSGFGSTSQSSTISPAIRTTSSDSKSFTATAKSNEKLSFGFGASSGFGTSGTTTNDTKSFLTGTKTAGKNNLGSASSATKTTAESMTPTTTPSTNSSTPKLSLFTPVTNPLADWDDTLPADEGTPTVSSEQPLPSPTLDDDNEETVEPEEGEIVSTATTKSIHKKKLSLLSSATPTLKSFKYPPVPNLTKSLSSSAKTKLANELEKALRSPESSLSKVMELVTTGALEVAPLSILNEVLLFGASKDNYQLVVSALTAGASVHARGMNEFTALLHAAELGNLKMLQLLLEHGSDVDATSKFADSAAIWCGKNSHANCIRVLHQYNANMNQKNDKGCTGLIWACEKGHLATVQALVEAGADVNLPYTSSGQTPLMYAAEKAHETVVEYLLSVGGADPNLKDKNLDTALTKAAWGSHGRIVQLLCEYGADVNVQNVHGSSPVVLATRSDCKLGVQALLEHNADPNIVTNQLDSALVWGSKLGRVEICGLLCQYGANPNLVNNAQCTALIWASEQNQPLICQYLIGSGADVNFKYVSNGYSPIHYAASKGYEKVVEILIANGADVNSLTNKNDTPLKLATPYKNVAKLLKEHGGN